MFAASAASRLQHPAGLPHASDAVRKEHNAELTHHDIKGTVGKRQRLRVGLLKPHTLQALLGRGIIEHRLVEICGDDLNHRRQRACQCKRDNPCPGGGLQQPAGGKVFQTLRHVRCIRRKHHVPEFSIIELGETARECTIILRHCSILHGDLSVRPQAGALA